MVGVLIIFVFQTFIKILGDDPLADVNDASDANSIASTLKLYLREQQPPLFPFYLFDLLTDCVKCSSVNEFVNKVILIIIK
jgi:hypothetical protein